MIPTKIRLRDFLSYREADLDLQGCRMVALAGPNGAGKSALAVDALTWGLWGESRARSDDDLVRPGASEFEVALTFEARDGTYRVVRRRRLGREGRPGATALALEHLAGEEAIKLTGPAMRDTQAKIDAVLGLDYRTFINTACLVQGKADQFTTAEPRERKEVLASILGLGHWQQWAQVAHERARRGQADVQAVEATIEQAHRLLEQKPDYEARLAEASATCDSAEATWKHKAAQLEEGRQLEGAQRDKLAGRTRLTAHLAAQRALLDSGQAELEQITGIIAGAPDKAHVVALEADLNEVANKAERLDALQGQAHAALEAVTARDRALQSSAEARRALASVEEQQQTLQVPTDPQALTVCPTCDRRLTGKAKQVAMERLAEQIAFAARLEGQREELAAEVGHAVQAVSAAQAELTKVAAPTPEDLLEARDATRALPDARAKLAQAVEQRKLADGLRGQVDAKAGSLEALAAEADRTAQELQALSLEIEAEGDMGLALHEAEVAEARASADLQDSRRQRDGLQGRLDQLATIATNMRTAEQEREQKVRYAADLADVERALGPKGIQAMLIDATLPHIVDEANRLLGLMTGGQTTIDLRTQRLGKTTGREIETLDVVISDAQGSRPYENYSGGERFRIDFAVRIGLSRVLARRADAPCKTLVIDEGFGSQDGTGRMALIEALASVREEFGLVMVISHMPDLQEYFPSIITVTKGPNGSRAILS